MLFAFDLIVELFHQVDEKHAVAVAQLNCQCVADVLQLPVNVPCQPAAWGWTTCIVSFIFNVLRFDVFNQAETAGPDGFG